MSEHLVMNIREQPPIAICLNCKSEEQMPSSKMSFHHWISIMDDFKKRHSKCEKELEVR